MANGMEIRQRIQTRMMQFTADLDALLRKLPACLAKDRLQDQLGRSGSSVGANFAESRAAESSKDFIHKLSMARWSDVRMFGCSDDNSVQSRGNTEVERGFPVSERMPCA